MNTLRLFAFCLSILITVYADSQDPRLFAEGKDYRVSIYKREAVIERKSDGEKKEIKGLLWGNTDLQKRQPKKFFDDESGMVLFLMTGYHYTLVNLEYFFEDEEDVLTYLNIEGGVFKSPFVIDRTNTSWSLDGVYSGEIIKGKASNNIGELDFTLDLSGRYGGLTSTNKKAPEIISLRTFRDDFEQPIFYMNK